MKYIVFWCIYVSAPCPMSKPDQWGRVSNVSCAALHWDKQKMNKEFTDRTAAFDFYKRSLIECGKRDYGVLHSCTDVSIDSVTDSDLIAVPCNKK